MSTRLLFTPKLVVSHDACVLLIQVLRYAGVGSDEGGTDSKHSVHAGCSLVAWRCLPTDMLLQGPR